MALLNAYWGAPCILLLRESWRQFECVFNDLLSAAGGQIRVFTFPDKSDTNYPVLN